MLSFGRCRCWCRRVSANAYIDGSANGLRSVRFELLRQR
ncbi:hypothetical protein SynBIOSE41_01234 [Synechococcus sp. BIOS-E4-1]|nr:hypothetical protein SynBIOSE41_01234 [Synechococcus sp. BIOS-E4-1]